MRRLLLCLLLASPLALPATVHARSEGRTLGYQRESVWSTTVRFLVVDEHARVIEKDADAGYVLFEVNDDGKAYRGSLEVITIPGDGRSSIKFAINIIDRPLWREAGMLQRLEQKIRHELGSPPPPPAKPRPKDDEPKDDRPDDKDKDGDGNKPPPRAPR